VDEQEMKTICEEILTLLGRSHREEKIESKDLGNMVQARGSEDKEAIENR